MLMISYVGLYIRELNYLPADYSYFKRKINHLANIYACGYSQEIWVTVPEVSNSYKQGETHG